MIDPYMAVPLALCYNPLAASLKNTIYGDMIRYRCPAGAWLFILCAAMQSSTRGAQVREKNMLVTGMKHVIGLKDLLWSQQRRRHSVFLLEVLDRAGFDGNRQEETRIGIVIRPFYNAISDAWYHSPIISNWWSVFLSYFPNVAVYSSPCSRVDNMIKSWQ